MAKAGSSMGVTTAPGQTALTRNPSMANRWANERMTPRTPPLDAQ